MNRRPRFATLATHVLDIRPIPNAAEDATGSKVTCEFEINGPLNDCGRFGKLSFNPWPKGQAAQSQPGLSATG